LSTLPTQANLDNSWKDEVNQRLAAHKSRKSLVRTELEGERAARPNASGRAVAAAARVAARYANAPSYSDVASADTRLKKHRRESEPVTKTEPVAAAATVAEESSYKAVEVDESSFLDAPGWEAYSAGAASAEWQGFAKAERAFAEGSGAAWSAEPEQSEAAVMKAGLEPEAQPLADVEAGAASYKTDSADDEQRDRRKQAARAAEMLDDDATEVAHPIHANLIQFPRELVATRRARPRRAEGPYAASIEQDVQLSIFEVDPGALTVEAAQTSMLEEAAGPAWTGPEWSGIELDAQPARVFRAEPSVEMLEEMPERIILAPDMELAPLSRRALAAVVNGSLIVGTFLVATMIALSTMKVMPGLKALEMAAAIGVAVVGAAYMTLFHYFTKGTPGMRYADLSLCTLDGQCPTRAQRCARLVALLLSILPAGLGVIWAIFDGDHLGWHDRLSDTYVRRR
jgi:uncharacterized RDD family membrane protein YckC